MAIIHREDSIKELNKQKEEKDQVINELGEQLAMAKIENMQIKAENAQIRAENAEMELIIDNLGAQQATTRIDLLQIKEEISALRGRE